MTRADDRPVLLAMNNPVSSNPAHALYPYPPGCAGHRVHEMLREEMARRGRPHVPSRSEYLAAFDRRNVLSKPVWSQREARASGREVLRSLSHRTVVVLGAQTLQALGLPRGPWGEWAEWDAGDLLAPRGDLSASVRYCLLPHPSGRCREYNYPRMRALAGRILADLLPLASGTLPA